MHRSAAENRERRQKRGDSVLLDNLKLLLGLSADDTGLDEKLRLIIANTTARLKILLGGIEPPEELDHIILEVSIVRFNKIGSEGLSAHTVEGESLSFSDDDFSGFYDEIQAFLASREDTKRGKVRFL